MAGKKKQDKEKDSWIADLEGYSRQIWLAGLGAYAKAGKEGSKMFESLIKDGEAAEKTAREEIDKQVESLKGKASKGRKDSVDAAKAKADKSREKVTSRWSGLEDAFEKRLNNAVSRLGVPSREEVKALDAKVDELSRLIDQMAQGNAPSAKVAPKAVPKATAQTAAAKSDAAKVSPKAAAKPAAAKAKPKAPVKPKAEAKPKAPRKPRAPVKPKAPAKSGSASGSSSSASTGSGSNSSSS